MPSTPYRNRFWLPLLVVALSLLMLTACSSAPTKPPLAPVPQQAIPMPAKPVAAMQPIASPPPPPRFSSMSQADQSREAIMLYSQTADTAAACLKARQVLIDWIGDLKWPFP